MCPKASADCADAQSAPELSAQRRRALLISFAFEPNVKTLCSSDRLDDSKYCGRTRNVNILAKLSLKSWHCFDESSLVVQCMPRANTNVMIASNNNID